VTVEKAINLRVVPYGIDHWNVLRVHDDRHQTYAGHIERHKSGLTVSFWAYDENGQLIKKEYNFDSAKSQIIKRQQRNLRRQHT
jgi:hypothetical protein